MPHPNIKRLRSAKYSGSQRHYYEMNSVNATKRTPVWNQILKNRNELAKINIPGGIHTLGNATNTGNLTFASDSVVNKSLVLGNGIINSVSQSFSIPDTVDFTWTHAAAAGPPQILAAAATDTGSVEILITPKLAAAGGKMTQFDLNSFNQNDIITLTGFQNLTAGGANGKDESWLNGVYQVTGFTVNLLVRTGIKLQRAGVTYTPLTQDNGIITGIIPSANGHAPVLTKHFRIQQYTSPNGDVTNYI
jgi:hypothetical protein